MLTKEEVKEALYEVLEEMGEEQEVSLLEQTELLQLIKGQVKASLREFSDEQDLKDSQTGSQRDITIFKLPCKHCSKPIISGQSFVLFHAECLDKEQELR